MISPYEIFVTINDAEIQHLIFSGVLATKSKQIAKAEEYKIHVVSKDALGNAIKTEGIISQFEKYSLCEWGTNVRK